MEELLIRFELSIGNVQIDKNTHHLFHMPLAMLSKDNFQNDDHFEIWTRFKISELSDLIGRLGLEEHVLVLNTPCNYHRFHREVLLMHTLTKLAHDLHHTVMSDMIVGGDSAMLGKGYNYFLNHLDERFMDIINVNSLNFLEQFS